MITRIFKTLPQMLNYMPVKSLHDQLLYHFLHWNGHIKMQATAVNHVISSGDRMLMCMQLLACYTVHI